MRYNLRHRQTDKREDGRKKGTHLSGFILHERRKKIMALQRQENIQGNPNDIREQM
jgi:hypothetical protein